MTERDEYTPSLDDVRMCYGALGSGPNWDERVIEFDRWLSAHDEAIRREERARIREREDELEEAFQSRDWDTVEHLQSPTERETPADEAVQRVAAALATYDLYGRMDADADVWAEETAPEDQARYADHARALLALEEVVPDDRA
jgi:hypothetical protein